MVGLIILLIRPAISWEENGGIEGGFGPLEIPNHLPVWKCESHESTLFPFLSRFPTSEGHTSMAIMSENVTFLGWFSDTWPEINGCKRDKTQRLGIKSSHDLFASPGFWDLWQQPLKNIRMSAQFFFHSSTKSVGFLFLVGRKRDKKHSDLSLDCGILNLESCCRKSCKFRIGVPFHTTYVE